MLESIVDLLNGLFLIAVIVLIVFSIVGSMVAALRAVRGDTATSTNSQEEFVDDVGKRSEQLARCRKGIPNALSHSKPWVRYRCRSCVPCR